MPRTKGAKDKGKRKNRGPATEAQQERKRKTEARIKAYIRSKNPEDIFPPRRHAPHLISNTMKKRLIQQQQPVESKQPQSTETTETTNVQDNQEIVCDVPLEQQNPGSDDNLNVPEVDVDEAEAHDENKDDIMDSFARAIHKRLRAECRTQEHKTKEGSVLHTVIPEKEKWLLNHLHTTGFWIRRHNVPYLHEQLVKHALLMKRWNPNHRTYYRDIRVWLPDVENPGVRVPCAKCCGCNTSRNAFPLQHPTRYVTGLDTSYYIMSAEYKCSSCKGHTTTMASNPESIQHLEPHIQLKFPCYLTHRSGVDLILADLLAGTTPRALPSFSNKRARREPPQASTTPPLPTAFAPVGPPTARTSPLPASVDHVELPIAPAPPQPESVARLEPQRAPAPPLSTEITRAEPEICFTYQHSRVARLITPRAPAPPRIELVDPPRAPTPPVPTKAAVHSERPVGPAPFQRTCGTRLERSIAPNAPQRASDTLVPIAPYPFTHPYHGLETNVPEWNVNNLLVKPRTKRQPRTCKSCGYVNMYCPGAYRGEKACLFKE